MRRRKSHYLQLPLFSKSWLVLSLHKCWYENNLSFSSLLASLFVDCCHFYHQYWVCYYVYFPNASCIFVSWCYYDWIAISLILFFHSLAMPEALQFWYIFSLLFGRDSLISLRNFVGCWMNVFPNVIYFGEECKYTLS